MTTTTNDLELIHQTANESFQQAAIAEPGLNTPEHSATMATAIVDQLTTSAASAITSVSQPSTIAAQRVWNDVLEILQSHGLTTAIYCTRSGRLLSSINMDAWQDYLDQIAALGETSQADHTLRNLVSAIIAQKAHTVAPVVLTTSATSLAMIRETSPADFICVALNQVFPMPRGAQSAELAIRAEKLGQARRYMNALPSASLQYACECLTLYLSHIRPHKLEANRNLLSFYGFAEQTDFPSAFQSIATLGHFCGRIIQQMIDLISQHRLRPVNELTQADLLSLRVHWQGSPVYQALRNARREWRNAQSQIKVPKIRGLGNANKLISDLATSIDTTPLDDFANSFLDTLDLSAAMQAGGRKVRVILESEKAAEIALAKHAELKAARKAAQEADEALQTFDLTSILVSGELPAELIPEIDTPQDMFDAGLVDFDDLAGFQLSDDDDDAIDDEDEQPELASWLENFTDEADQKAAAKKRHALPPATHKQAAIHAAVSALSAGEIAATTRPPLKRTVAQTTPAQIKMPDAPKPPTTPRTPIRRVIKS